MKKWKTIGDVRRGLLKIGYIPQKRDPNSYTKGRHIVEVNLYGRQSNWNRMYNGYQRNWGSTFFGLQKDLN